MILHHLLDKTHHRGADSYGCAAYTAWRYRLYHRRHSLRAGQKAPLYARGVPSLRDRRQFVAIFRYSALRDALQGVIRLFKNLFWLCQNRFFVLFGTIE